MSKFTKGKWIVYPYTKGDGEGYQIGTGEDYIGEINKEADARLIAAAPELVEALKLAYSNLGATAISEHTFTHVRSKMREALAKVEGKEGKP